MASLLLPFCSCTLLSCPVFPAILKPFLSFYLLLSVCPDSNTSLCRFTQKELLVCHLLLLPKSDCNSHAKLLKKYIPADHLYISLKEMSFIAFLQIYLLMIWFLLSQELSASEKELLPQNIMGFSSRFIYSFI